MRRDVCVIGASNIDIIAAPAAKLIYADSNPGTIRTGYGGVGRNIAECLVRLGKSVRLISAFGGDAFAKGVMAHARGLGIDISGSLMDESAESCLYACISDESGDLCAAIADMRLCDELTPDFFKGVMGAVNDSRVVALDANLSESAIAYVCDNCSSPIFADAVSLAKAPKLTPSLPRLTGLKGNRREISRLSGVTVTDENSARAAAASLHALGIECVMITFGEEGAFASVNGNAWLMPSMVHDPVNTSGCGDAFLAGAICAYIEGPDCASLLRYGLAAAAVCAGSESPVSPELSICSLKNIIKGR